MQSAKSVNQSKHERQSQRTFSEGGKTKMFAEQQASSKKPATTGKADARGPGKKSAEGGPPVRSKSIGGLARPARPGQCGT
jgi:hypothetical protein